MPHRTFFNLSEEKRRKILEAATKIFARNRYPAITVDSLVQEAGIPKGSFYQYFRDKDDLYRYLFHDMGRQKADVLHSVLEAWSGESFCSLMEHMLREGMKFENKDPQTRELKERFLRECPQEVKLEILRDIVPDTRELFARLIGLFIRNGTFRRDLPADLPAYILTAVVLGPDQPAPEGMEDPGDLLMGICQLLEEAMKSGEPANSPASGKP